jgi:amino acid transporter
LLTSTVLPAREISDSDLLVAGRMFERATNSTAAARVAAAFVALSNLGNVFSFSFGLARLDLEYGRSGMLPFSRFFARTTKHGSPAAGVGVNSCSMRLE